MMSVMLYLFVDSSPVEVVAKSIMLENDNTQDAEIKARPMQFEKTMPNEING